MKDIFPTSDYHLLGFSLLELDIMDTASRSSGRVNKEIRIDRKSCPRARSRYPYSSTDVMTNLDIYIVKGTNLLRD